MYEPLESVGVPPLLQVFSRPPGCFPYDGTPDLSARVQHWFLAVSEHPGIRKHLERHGLKIGINDEGRVGIQPRDVDRKRAFTLDLWRDPAIRPVFEQYELTVWEG